MTAAPPGVAAVHPLLESDRLAQQAASAVELLERFGDLLTVALQAVGAGDDAALTAALVEREGVLVELEPVLASLARARDAVTTGPMAGPHARRALAAILRPVDEALRHAQLLHVRLTDEVADREPLPRPSVALMA